MQRNSYCIWTLCLLSLLMQGDGNPIPKGKAKTVRGKIKSESFSYKLLGGLELSHLIYTLVYHDHLTYILKKKRCFHINQILEEEAYQS